MRDGLRSELVLKFLGNIRRVEFGEDGVVCFCDLAEERGCEVGLVVEAWFGGGCVGGVSEDKFFGCF